MQPINVFHRNCLAINRMYNATVKHEAFESDTQLGFELKQLSIFIFSSIRLQYCTELEFQYILDNFAILVTGKA